MDDLHIPEVWADKPHGGFVLIEVEKLLAAWWAYEHNNISLFSLRTWLASHELLPRRCQLAEKYDQPKPVFRIQEFMELTGQQRKSVIRKALKELEEAGLSVCRKNSIGFPSAPKELANDPLFQQRLALIENNRRKVPFPRRLLRYLATRSRATTIATVFGHLLTLLYHRNKRVRADGACKASWVAEVFSLTVSSIKRCRKDLIKRGILVAQEVPRWYWRRYGWRGYLNLEWGRPSCDEAVDDCSATSPKACSKLHPKRKILHETAPSTKQVSPFGNIKPISSKKTGFGKQRFLGKRLSRSELADDSSLNSLFLRCVEAKLVYQENRLNFFAAAEKVLRSKSIRCPVSVFVWLVKGARWGRIAACDEDSAKKRLDQLDGIEQRVRKDTTRVIRTSLGGIERLTVTTEPDSRMSRIGDAMSCCTVQLLYNQSE